MGVADEQCHATATTAGSIHVFALACHADPDAGLVMASDILLYLTRPLPRDTMTVSQRGDRLQTKSFRLCVKMSDCLSMMSGKMTVCIHGIEASHCQVWQADERDRLRRLPACLIV